MIRVFNTAVYVLCNINVVWGSMKKTWKQKIVPGTWYVYEYNVPVFLSYKVLKTYIIFKTNHLIFLNENSTNKYKYKVHFLRAKNFRLKVARVYIYTHNIYICW